MNNSQQYFVTILLLCALTAVPALFKTGKGLDLDYSMSNKLDRMNEDKVAKIGQFPYAASIQYWGYHYCVGTLVTPNWVVSVAQCFRLGITDGLTVAAGLVNITNENVDLDMEEKTVRQIIIHPKYYVSDKCHIIVNDIALLKTTTPFNINVAIKPVALPAPKRRFLGKVTLIGWSSHGFRFISLKYAQARILNKKKCLSQMPNLPRYIGFKYHNMSMICAKPIDTSFSLCMGNTGSPLIYKGILVGIASLGDNPCKLDANKSFIGYFTKISRYIKFINKHIRAKHDTIKND